MSKLPIAALALLAASVPACTDGGTTTTDVVQAVVVRGTTILAAACAEDGTAAWYLSNDDASFARLPTDAALCDRVELTVHRGAFVAHVTHGATHAVLSSDDGRTWRTFEQFFDFPSAFVDGDELILANDTLIVVTADRATWEPHQTDHALVNPRVIRGHGIYAAAESIGQISTSPDGEIWTVYQPGQTLNQVGVMVSDTAHRFHALAKGEVDRVLGSYLLTFDPAVPRSATFVPISADVAAMVMTPTGLLLGDGTVMPEGDPGQRRAVTDAFLDAFTDGARVVVAHEHDLALSTDGGATFVPLPL